MKTISTTAISTENARSRIQDNAPHMLALPVVSRTGSLFTSSLSCIPACAVKNYRRFCRCFGCPAPALRQTEEGAQHREGHRSGSEGPAVKLTQVEGSAFGILIVVAQFVPGGESHVIAGQLAGSQFGALQLFDGLGVFLERLLLHQVHGFLV